MAKVVSCLLLIVAMSVTSGCGTRSNADKGFTLPEGNAEVGKANYVKLKCNACHWIDGIEQRAAGGADPEMSIALGGPVTRIKDYGDLVTSIINPSHRLAQGFPVDAPGAVSVDGKSKMRNYNDVMTVTQLVDLVMFVESKYSLLPYARTAYRMYYEP